MPVLTHARPLTADNLQLMVECWLARNGHPRRFLPGESIDFYAVQAWLQRRGYVLSSIKGKFSIQLPGQSRRNLSWRQVIEMVDELRRGEGLQPYRL